MLSSRKPELNRILFAAFFIGMAALATQGYAQDLDKVTKAAESGKGPSSILDLLVSGGWVMIPLGLCSVLALAFAVERFISLKRSKLMPPEFIEGLRDIYSGSGKDISSVMGYCQETPCPISKIFLAGARRSEQGEEAMEKAIEDAGAREVSRMKRSLRPLGVIARISPLLGLLGTVYGMISAFQSVSLEDVGKANALAIGIYEALITTATGLTLAIPVLIVHQILSSRVDSIVDHIDDQAIEFLEYAAYGKVPVSPPALDPEDKEEAA